MLLRFERHSKPINQNWSYAVLCGCLFQAIRDLYFQDPYSMFILAFWALLLRIDIIGKAFISHGFYLYFIAQLLFGFHVGSNRCRNIADSKQGGNMVMYRLGSMLYTQCKPIRRSLWYTNKKQKTENADLRREKRCFQCKEQENRIKWGIYKKKCQ